MKFKEIITSRVFPVFFIPLLLTAVMSTLILAAQYASEHYEIMLKRRICAKYYIRNVPIQTADDTDSKVGVILTYYVELQEEAEEIPSPEYLKTGIREKISEIIGKVDTFKTISTHQNQLEFKILKELQDAEPESCQIQLQFALIDIGNALPDTVHIIFR